MLKRNNLFNLRNWTQDLFKKDSFVASVNDEAKVERYIRNLFFRLFQQPLKDISALLNDLLIGFMVT